MRMFRLPHAFALVGFFCASLSPHAKAQAAAAPTVPVVDLSQPFGSLGGTVTSDAVTVKTVTDAGHAALEITVQPSAANYPGIDIAPAGGKLDVSKYGWIEATLVGTTDKRFRASLRIDNDGDWHLNPWNAEIATLQPGKPSTVRVYFGRSFGNPAFALNPAAITHIKLIGGKSTEVLGFRVESIVAGGKPGDKPPIDPATIRLKLVDGVVFGKSVPFDASKQLSTTAGAKATYSPETNAVAGEWSDNPKQTVQLKPAIGRWDLRDYTEVKVLVKNTGTGTVTPTAAVASNDGMTDTIASSTPLQPGQERWLTISFLAAHPWHAKPASSEQRLLWNGVAGTGTDFASDKASAIVIGVQEARAAASLLIEQVSADAPQATMPAWLGMRPPIPGNWTRTFDDEFSGSTLDATKWNVAGENYYDQRTHWSKDEVLIGDGHATLRYEKKTGFQNDDPAGKKTEYAAGFLDTFDKFAQRYGYFESRMKLPSAPGLWPAFWMMPDRGPAAGNRFKRSDTRNGGMEIDIMEFLSRWGIYRYNTALHWDGYGKDHRQTGNQKNYVQPDKDGFITAGVLWEPGLIVFYCNGKEMDRFEDPRVPTAPAYMMFTEPSGGWDNDQIDDAKLPAGLVIDYVRVWQRKDLVDAAPAPTAATPEPPASR